MDSHATDQCNDKHAYRLGPSDIDALPRKWLARLPASVHRGRSGRRPPPRHVDPVGRVLPDPDARHTDLGSDLPRAGHPRQPRHRPPRSGRSRLRRPSDPPRPSRDTGTVPDQGDHRRGSPRACTWTTNTPQSSSTGRPRAPRPPSPTPTISGSGNDRRICPRCGRSATPPTGACSASNESATSPSPGPDALHTVTAPVTTATGTRIPGLCLGEQRSHALLTALPLFRLQPNGVANKDLRPLIAELRASPPDTVTYDL